MKERLFAMTAELAALTGVSGFEQPVVRRLRDWTEPLADEVEVDALGNLYAFRRATGGSKRPLLMIAAHSDEIGMVVRYVEPGGFLRFETLGGVTDGLLPARAVSVNGRAGVIGVKAGHFQTDEDRGRVRPHRELYIDVGAESAEEVAALGIRVGDPVTWQQPLMRLSENRVAGKAVDNRLGCAVLVEILQALKDRELSCDVCLAVNVQEEVGLRGAQQTAYRVRPDAFLALDTIPCGGTPDVPESVVQTGIGKGPVVSVVNGGPRGLIAHPGLLALLRDASRSTDVPLQEALFYGGTNDAAAAFLVAGGIPAASVCLPRRYSHSPVECADLRDAEGTVRLLTEAALTFCGQHLHFI